MWSKVNTKETWFERKFGDGEVVRALAEDEETYENGEWPFQGPRPKMNRQNKRVSDRVLRQGKPKRGKKS